MELIQSYKMYCRIPEGKGKCNVQMIKDFDNRAGNINIDPSIDKFS